MKKHFGFSLIELMIAVSIIGITASLAFPSFRTWIENTRIRNTAESVVNGLQLARAEAVKRNTNVQFTFTEGAAWSVGCVVPVGDDNGDGEVDCPREIQSRQTGDDKSDKIVITSSDDGPYVFNSLGRVSPAPADEFIQINVDIDTSVLSPDESRDLRINVGVGGNIKMCDPTVSEPTDLRICP